MKTDRREAKKLTAVTGSMEESVLWLTEEEAALGHRRRRIGYEGESEETEATLFSAKMK